MCTIHSHGFRIIAVAGLLSTSLTAPATMGAQTVSPERALLSRTATATAVAGLDLAWGRGAAVDPTHESEGERALLGRAGTGQIYAPSLEPASVASQVSRPAVGGERALLGRWATVEPARRAFSSTPVEALSAPGEEPRAER